jgi:hypothetical protein
MARHNKVLKQMQQRQNRINKALNPDRAAPQRRKKAATKAKAKAKKAPLHGFLVRHALTVARKIRGVP